MFLNDKQKLTFLSPLLDNINTQNFFGERVNRDVRLDCCCAHWYCTRHLPQDHTICNKQQIGAEVWSKVCVNFGLLDAYMSKIQSPHCLLLDQTWCPQEVEGKQGWIPSPSSFASSLSLLLCSLLQLVNAEDHECIVPNLEKDPNWNNSFVFTATNPNSNEGDELLMYSRLGFRGNGEGEGKSEKVKG